MPRPVQIHHCTSEPYRFFGRTAELALLDQALDGGFASLVAFSGPGGQGKTAIVQHWLGRIVAQTDGPDGVFFWSFYRGKEADLCLRALYSYATGAAPAADLAASYCVDRVLPVLRRERWALILDGAEVAQYDAGSWQGRFLHPELGRLLEELASEPTPGVAVLTTRFDLPTLVHRRHARLLGLSTLDPESARGLLQSLGVHGAAADLDRVADAGGWHAKGVELLGTYLAHYHGGAAAQLKELPTPLPLEGASAEEQGVARVVAAFQAALAAEAQDVLSLTTSFRDPTTEARLLDYLIGPTVRTLLHDTWGRTYTPFTDRGRDWISGQVQELVDLRLLERVGRAGPASAGDTVIDAHPLVRRAFEHVRGGRDQAARSRAGFLRGRPDRRRPDTLEEAREEVELFHAFRDAGLWDEADSTYVALDNPKHRFLAPAFERDLLVQFFPNGDWRRPPLWPGFGRYRSLAICLEMLGQFDDALAAYRPADAPLRGDALLALGRLGPLLETARVPAPWQPLWDAYRSHALCLAGRTAEAVALARSLVPVDVYEWVHVFECMLRAGRLDALDLNGLFFRAPQLGADHRWAELARQRMRADYRRVSSPRVPAPSPERRGGENLGDEYAALLEAYDRGGLPWERALVRLGYAAWRLHRAELAEAAALYAGTLQLAEPLGMHILAADAWSGRAEVARRQGDGVAAKTATAAADAARIAVGYLGAPRP
jgi:tetratricopeptide (TPR) repeat protein